MKPLVFAADAGNRDYVSCIGLGRARIARASIVTLSIRLEVGKSRSLGWAAEEADAGAQCVAAGFSVYAHTSRVRAEASSTAGKSRQNLGREYPIARE